MTKDASPLAVIPGGRDQLERELIDLMFAPESIRDADVERLTAHLQRGPSPALQVVTNVPPKNS